MRGARTLSLAALALFTAVSLAAQRSGATQGATVYDLVVSGGRVVDPVSGLDATRDVGVAGGRIAEISASPLRGRRTVDARGLVVAPGFIDVHAHGQTAETYRFQSLDGVTTSLELELGTADVRQWYEERKAGQRINYGVSAGHIKVRMAVLADPGRIMPVAAAAYRAASPAEVEEIGRRIERGLADGAVSIGAGFPYTPAATRDELLSVFRISARTSTPVHVHIRQGVDGLKEALGLAQEAGASLHVVHINSAGYEETPEMLRMIAAARQRGQDVTTEAYPYDAGMTQIESATVQDPYTHERADRVSELEWPLTGERLNADSFKKYSQIGGPVVIHRNTEEMVARAISDPLTMIGSDAYWLNGTGHPRTTGTFSRVLGRYVRDTHALTLMEAIRKMTLMPAQRLEARVPAMKRKGRIAVGADADLTIFDPARVLDHSTYRQPSLPPTGIQYVFVNGVAVVSGGRAVEGVTPGVAIRAPAAHGTAVLFIGNSFTFGALTPVQTWRPDSVTDLNHEGIGGVPALFKSFTKQAGLDYDVSLETHPGVGFDWHLQNKHDALVSRPWDVVVMHGFSTLDSAKPGDPAKLVETTKQMAELLTGRNPKVEIHLTATWSRADQTYLETGHWHGQPIAAMARDVRAGYDKAAATSRAIKSVIPVGEAWLRAIDTGVADPNPYDGITPGQIDLWARDHYHASVEGYYLEALMVFGDVTGRDPRSLGEGECSAFELGMPASEAKALQQVAFAQLATTKKLTPGPRVERPAAPARCSP